MTDFPHLFSPLSFSGLELPNRIIMAPMGTNLATDKGRVTERMMDHYIARAKGGAGLIITEGASVHPSGHGYPFQLVAFDDEAIEGLTKLAKAVHRAGAGNGPGTKIFLQLHHGGRNTDMRVSGRLPLAPSPVRSPVGKITPEKMSLDQIELMVEAFGTAAERAAEAGFDGVELHGAHEYLIHQFMTPYCNRRTDQYGGGVEGRLRFPLEIIARIRRKLAQLPISFRFTGLDHHPAGLEEAETEQMAQRLVAAGVNLLNVTGGLFETPQLLIPPLDTPEGTHLGQAARLRRAVEVPVAGVGRITGPDLAEQALAQGQVDLVATARAFLTDPRWPQKAAAGRPETIRRCVGCNQGCIDYFFAGYPITCLYNPAAGRDRLFRRKSDTTRRRVVVVGAGPAGLEAARLLDERGHRVMLFESEPIIGGQVNLAAKPPGKAEFNRVIEFYRRCLDNGSVDLRLNTRADLELVLAEEPEAVVVATGSLPVEYVRGDNYQQRMVTARQVLAGQAQPGRNVVILGGGNVGLETASYLLNRKHQVTVIEMGRQIGQDLGPARRYLLMRHLRQMRLKRMVNCIVRRIHDDVVSYIRIQREGDRIYKEMTGVDTFVNALGVRPLDDLAQQLEASGRMDGIKVRLVGDALNPGKIINATAEGARAALEIDGM